MPPTVSIAAFVLGSVLLLISVVSGGFKIFGAEVSGTAGVGGRVVAFLLGIVLLVAGFVGSRTEVQAPAGPVASNERRQDESAQPRLQPPAANVRSLPSAMKPSFSCAEGVPQGVRLNAAERMICGSSELAVLDLAMANAYRDRWAEHLTAEQRGGLKAAQIAWLRKVRDSCPDENCLKRTYETHLAELRQGWP
jgi:uncharacterized protein YecT (DUF1311 family)